MKLHKKKGLTPSAANRKPKKARKTRAEKRAEKKAVLPLHKRPVICPPDKAGRHPLFRWGGFLCRALVIWLAASGLVIFMSNALDLGVADPVVLAVAFVAVALASLFRLGKVCKLISLGATGGLAAVLFAVNLRLPMDLFHGVLSLYNAALDRLYRVGYTGYVRFKVTIASPTPVAELLTVGVCLLTVAVAVVFTLFLFRRTKLLLPAVLATGVLVVLLTFNIYSNSIASNLGIVLVMISFASVLVMAAFDRLYRSKDMSGYDTELRLFDEGDRPTLPAGYMSPKEARRARREARKLARAQKKAVKKNTAAEGVAPATESRAKASPAPKKSKAEKAEIKKQLKAYRKYEWVSEQSRIAMGGYAAAAMLLVCTLAIALPAMMVRDNFKTIDAIDEKMELARNYVTALLRGDDDELDRYEYQANSDNFKPHSTELTHPQYQGTQIFYVTSRYDTNYYLRGWIGTDYENGAWLAPDENAVNYYHRFFGKEASPSEDLKYQFFHYMKPELVDDPAYTENIFTRYQLNKDHGFVNVLVNLRRINSPSTLTYFPSTFDPRYGVFEGYGKDAESPVSFVNYYDGLYTGRKYHESGLSYSTYTYAPVMTDDTWIENVAALEAAYALQKEVLLAQTGYYTNSNGKVTSYLKLDVTEDEKTGAAVFKYTYTRDTTTKVWLTAHESYVKQDNQYIVTTPGGTMTLTVKGREVVEATYKHYEGEGATVKTDLVDGYNYTMTVEDGMALMEYINAEAAYGDFVYQMYLGKSGSEKIGKLADTILDQVHREEIRTHEETVPDDPETPEDESYTYVVEERVNVSVPRQEILLAALKNASDPHAYEMRDLLVRNVIDYIIDEMGCTYTLEPDLELVDPEMDGVENFLFNTHEGYCVQFASAAALLLREMGIPTRYVEGYVADDFKKIDRQEFIYGAYVLDRQEHAWIEVYFDGVGWIQYETTPPYYAGLYGQSSTVGATPVPPAYPEDNQPTPPSDSVTPDDEETSPDDTEETTVDEELVDAEVARAGLVMLVILIVMGAGVAGVGSVISRARAAEEHRRSLASQVLDGGFGEHTAERDRREIALELSDAVTGLLSYFALSPRAGEFKDEYADRLIQELTAEPEGQKARKERNMPDLPDIHRVLDGMAAEEFGHGMSVEEMRELASLYFYLRLEIRRRIPLMTRLKLRYIQRKI